MYINYKIPSYASPFRFRFYINRIDYCDCYYCNIIAVAGPTIGGAFKAARYQKLIAEITKDLTAAKETAEKLYKGDKTVTDADLNAQLKQVTDKLAKVDAACGEDAKNYSSILTQIDDLNAQLKLYNQGDSTPQEKSLLDKFIGILDAAKKKFTK